MTNKRVEVQLTRAAQKDLKNLRHDLQGVAKQLVRLETDPTAGHLLRGSLAGARSLEFSLRGGGAYRAVYVVHQETVCIVFIIGPHENIYRKAESRLAALRQTLD
jgi:mRNA-degrading endonuclease RelE of RelBE toxin-antitoxin system